MALSEDRINELAHALAEALIAADVEQLRSIRNSMSAKEQDAVTADREVAALLKLVGEQLDRISRLADALLGAMRAADDESTDTDATDRLVDSISEPERTQLVRELASRVLQIEA